MTIPVPGHGFGPGRIIVSAAISAGVAVAYLTACARASQACAMIGPRACAPAGTTHVLLAVSLVIGAVTGLAAWLFTGQPHIQDFIHRSGTVILHTLMTAIPVAGLGLILAPPFSHTMPHPAGTIAAFTIPAVLAYAVRRVLVSGGVR
jgi:hypothetical protein